MVTPYPRNFVNQRFQRMRILRNQRDREVGLDE